MHAGRAQTYSSFPNEAYSACMPACLGLKGSEPFIPIQAGIQPIAWIPINSPGTDSRPPLALAYRVKELV